jgi:hypothetical protein
MPAGIVTELLQRFGQKSDREARPHTSVIATAA